MIIKKVFYKIIDALIYAARALKIYDKVCSATIIVINYINRKKFLKFYSRFIKKDSLCFDIGANIGARTDVMLKLGARVVAVEPQEVCVEKLKKKFKGNDRVVLVEKAAGEERKKEELMISDEHTISSMSTDWINSLKSSDMFFVNSSVFEWQDSVEVQVITLDMLIEKYGVPDFCKIDVEGYEYNVLKGLSQPIRMISFEFTPTEKFIKLAAEIVGHLYSIGRVEFNYTLSESIKFELNKWIGPKEFLQVLPQILNKTSVCGDIYARFY